MLRLLILYSAIALAALAALAANAEEDQCAAGNISSHITAEAKTSMLHTVEHHWKFSFWHGAVCWGRPDDQYQSKQNFAQESNLCAGKIDFATNQNNQANYSPMTLSWGANLTDGDTFTIKLDDKRTQAVYQEDDGDCTGNRYGSKTESATVTYETRAVIPVPEDVWMVQVRAQATTSDGQSLADLQPQIGRQSLKNEKAPTAYLQRLDKREWTYLYVEPGEKLDVAIAYAKADLGGERKYNAQFDFKFIGHNRCVEALGDPKAVDYSPEFLQKTIEAEVKTDVDYHNYAVKLGCMRNPVFLRAAMNHSRPEAILPALNAISKRTEAVVNASREDADRKTTFPYFATILDMTLVDVSRFALTDLLTYCKTYNDFTREAITQNAPTEVDGINFMMMTYSHLEMIYSQLARRSLDVLVSNLDTWSKQDVTYAQLFDGNKDAQTALRAYQQAMVQMGLEIYTTIFSEITTHVEERQISKLYRDQLLADLQDAATVADYVDVSIRQTFRDFGRRSNEVINAGALAANVRKLNELDRKVHDEMKAYFKYFIATESGGDNGDRFVKTLGLLQKQIMEPSAQMLQIVAQKQNLKSLDEKFVRRDELNQIGKQIGKCIFHPYGVRK